MLKRLLAWIKGSLTKRLLIYLFLVIAAQIILTGAIGYRWIFSYIESISDANALELNASLVQETNYIRGNYEKQAESIMVNQTIQDVLSKEYMSNTAAQSTDNTAAEPDPDDRKAVEWALMDPENKILSILVGKNTLFQSRTAINPYISYDDIVSGGLYAKALASDGADIWVASREDITAKENSPKLFLCKTINLTKYDFHALGHLIMQIPPDELDAVFDQRQLAENEYFAVVDGDGLYIYHSLDQNLIGEPLDDDLRFIADAGTDISQTVNTGCGPMMIYYSPYVSQTGEAGWGIIHAAPMSVTSGYANRIRNLVSGIMLVLLVISTPLAFMLFNGITAPIIKLKNAVAAFGTALHTRVKVDRRDEIGSLQESFNWMADDIENLMVEKDENHMRLRKLELSALEYQVNPHFLYNSLDSVYWMARKAGSPDVAEMIRALAGFLRIGLSKGQESYHVKDELEHVRQYLMINKIRLKDSFEFVVSASEEILEYPVIKIILQPVVENAVKYGIGKTTQIKGLIKVSGYQEDGRIVFTVTDNGPGIPPDRLSVLEKSLAGPTVPSESENGFGLHYVSQRLNLYYGKDAHITLENVKTRGLAVSVLIPTRI